MRSFLYLIALSLAAGADAYAREAWPGIRYPSPEDVRGAWSGSETPYHVRADFDGNGLIDDAWVLIIGRYGWRIEVFLAEPSGKSRSKILEEIRNPSLPPQRVVLSAVDAPVRIITSRNIQIKDCVPDEQFDIGPGCTTIERKETTIQLPGVRFCIVNGGCATYLWNAQRGFFEPTPTLVLPIVQPGSDAFVGRRHSSNMSEIAGVRWNGSGGVWTGANGAKYTVGTAGFPSETGMLIRYLWLEKILTTDPSDLEGLEIRFAASVEPYPPSARYDLGSCQVKEQDKTVVAIIDGLPNGKMRPLQAWLLDVNNEKLIPVDVEGLDCRDRKW